MKDYVTLDPDDDDADFRFGYIDNMLAQFKQDLYSKNFSLQDQGKGDQIDTDQNRIKNSLNIIDMGRPIPDNQGLDYPVRGAVIFPQFRELKKLMDILKYK